MTRDDIMAKLRAHEAELRAAGVEALWLFGSFARGGAGAGSDVDLLYDGAESRSLVDWFNLRERFGAIVGGTVDVHRREALRARVRARVEPQSVRVF